MGWISAALLSLLSYLLISDGKSLVSEGPDGALTDLGSSAWLSYPSSMTRYPQCCGDKEGCKMLRLSESVISSLALSTPKVRLRFTGKYGNMEAILAFEESTGSATGQAVLDGKLYYIEPTTEDERTSEPCFKEGQREFMRLFHKLIYMKDDKKHEALPPSLVSPLQGAPTSGCCEGSVPDVCTRVMVNDTFLNKQEVMFPLPWRGPNLHQDTLEYFTLASTKPSPCVGRCDIYFYGGSAGLNLKAVLDGSDAILSIIREGLKFSVKYCEADRGYVLTAGPALTSKTDLKLLTADGETRAAGRTVELGCNYREMYCNPNPDHYVLDEKKNCEYDDCRKFCAETNGCKHFTWYKSRGGKTCYALTTCLEERYATCLKAEACISGPVSCDNTTTVVTGCKPPAQLGPEFIPWQCNGPQGNVLTAAEMSETLQVGSSCYLRCDSWVTASGSQGYLESTCDSDGEWTTTVPHNDDEELQTPKGPYPLPTNNETSVPAPLKCACSPLHVMWPPEATEFDENNYYYDPNDEEGTDFVCKTHLNGTYIVMEDNLCFMYCDTHLTASIKCNDGVWTGQPNLGFWCYTQPTGREPIPTTPPNMDSTTTTHPTTTTTEIPEIALVAVGGWIADGKRASSDIIFPSADFECQIDDLPEARAGLVTFLLGELLLACGGVDTDECTKINGNSPGEVHSLLSSLDRQYASYAKMGGEHCILGGKNLNSIDCLNEGLSFWNEKPEKIPGIVYFSCVTNMPDGGLLVIGGKHAATQVLYWSSSGGWETWASMSEARDSHSCSLMAEGLHVMVAGGRSNGNYISSTRIFSVGNKTWKSGPDMKFPRTNFGLLKYEGMLYAYGGYCDTCSPYTATDSIQYYDEDKDEWITSEQKLSQGSYSSGYAVVPTDVLDCK